MRVRTALTAEWKVCLKLYYAAIKTLIQKSNDSKPTLTTGEFMWRDLFAKNGELPTPLESFILPLISLV
jgi:hypothetical protein